MEGFQLMELLVAKSNLIVSFDVDLFLPTQEDKYEFMSFFQKKLQSHHHYLGINENLLQEQKTYRNANSMISLLFLL